MSIFCLINNQRVISCGNTNSSSESIYDKYDKYKGCERVIVNCNLLSLPTPNGIKGEMIYKIHRFHRTF